MKEARIPFSLMAFVNNKAVVRFPSAQSVPNTAILGGVNSSYIT